MQLKEILSIEENRTEDSRGVIHLFQEGTFYRAYEWSAWLCHRYVHQFKVTHKLFRNIEFSVLFVKGGSYLGSLFRVDEPVRVILKLMGWYVWIFSS